MLKGLLCGNVVRFLFMLIGACVLVGNIQGQSLSVTASPASLTIYPGQQNVPLIVTASSGAYSGPIVVTLTGLPSGISVSPLTIMSGTSGTLYLTASLSAGQENFQIINPTPATSWTAQSTLVAAAGSLLSTSPLPLTISISNPSFAPAPSAINLPIVNIDTGGVPVIDKTTDVPGTITSSDSQTAYLPNSSDTDNTAVFHLHGNSTTAMPKLPYEFKLNTSLDLLNTMGLSCPYVTGSKAKPTCDKSKTYILLANYDDKTLLRDWSASALANAIPIGNGYLGSSTNSPSPSGTSTLMPWAPHSLFVELYLNGIYEGNYQLIEKINVDSHRVNITELSESDITPSAVTGGYLMEIDHYEDEAYVFFTPQNIPIGLTDPDFSPDPEIPEQTSYISNYVDAAETALFSPNFTDPVQGWRGYFDEASAVNFYIVNDVMGNVDGGDFFSSDYLYKDLNNSLIYMGPVWDFDISSGNINYAQIVNPTVPWMQEQSAWYKQWFQDPSFKADVATQWNGLKNNDVFSNWLKSIQQQANALEQSQANNFARWPMQGIEVWPNAQAVGSYDGEVQYFVNWLNLRIQYLDSLFNNKKQTSTILNIISTSARYGSSIALSAQVAGGTTPSGNVAFLANGIMLGTVPLAGSTASFTTSALPQGTVAVEAIYAGDTQNALSASATQTITVQPQLIPTVTSLAGPSATPNQVSATAFSVSVVGSSGTASPTGLVSLIANNLTLASTSLSASGVATFATTLPVGQTSVQVSYSGDTNYQASTSNSLSLDVIAVPDFSLTTSTPVETSGSKSTTVTLTVTPLYGFTQAIDFACSPSVPSITCSFSPSTVTPGSGPSITTVTFLNNGTSARILASPIGTRFAGAIAMAFLFCLPKKRRRIHSYFVAAILLLTTVALTACGSASSQPLVPVTISATGGGLTRSIPVNVTIE